MEKNKYLNRNDINTLEMLAKSLQDGINVVRKTDIKCDVPIHGLLITKQQTHQDLHLDCSNPNFEQEYESLIIHEPLSTERCCPRIGQYMKKQ